MGRQDDKRRVCLVCRARCLQGKRGVGWYWRLGFHRRVDRWEVSYGERSMTSGSRQREEGVAAGLYRLNGD